jgi:type II restriction/modification system DNA methylase subunit YeeA
MLKEKHGISESNIDILLNPLFNLNLIIEENLPGIDNCIFLINDVYFCRLPIGNTIKHHIDSDSPGDKMYISEITDFFKNYTPENNDSEDQLVKISRIFSDSTQYKLLNKLSSGKLKKDRFLSLMGQDLNLLRDLKQLKLIIEIEDYIYPMAEIHFFKFNPIYLISNLKNRYINEEISTDQFIRHIRLIKTKEMSRTIPN